jgi:hypothetical protein
MVCGNDVMCVMFARRLCVWKQGHRQSKRVPQMRTTLIICHLMSERSGSVHA